jgi:hypothetical protein
MVCDTIQTVIKWFVEMNWGIGKECPKFRLYPKTSPTPEDASMAVSLTQAGVKFTKNYFQEHFSLDESEFDIKEDVVPQTPFGGAPDVVSGTPGKDVKDIAEATKNDKDPSTNSAKNTKEDTK